MKRRFTREEAPMYNELMDAYEMKKKSIWPYEETYKGHKLEVFRDGSVIVRDKCIEEADCAFKDLTEAFGYIDKKEKMNINTTCSAATIDWTGNIIYDYENSLAPCVPQDCFKQAAVPCQYVDVKCPPKKGNNPMYIDNDKHIESSKINYLSDRASAVYYSKSNGLPKLFGFGPFDAPETLQDMIDRLTSGKFTFKDETKKNVKGFYYRQLDGITWKDPSVKEDQAGFDVAYAALLALYQDTKDIVAIGTPAEGLAAVKALDAWTPTVGTA